ncbi:MAG TPA: trypsin-like peptidase domain-containing protein [Opitutaceae bacterium]|nr:trypsin-like peptidase domain-containing protein [Opitutaceae bacterium]
MTPRSLAYGAAAGGVVGLAVGLLIARSRTEAPTLVVDSSPADVAAPALGSYAEALAAARPAVVSVYSTKYARARTGLGPALRGSPVVVQPERGLGSGVIVSAEGYILTNNHVVEGADSLLVKLPDDRELPARLVGADPKTDVAVIKVEGANLPFVVIGDSDKLRVGDIVFALGNPLDVGQTATMGIVSATGRRGLDLLARGDSDPGYEDFIQTDAAINVGNSGGALVDSKGRLVGINTAIMTTTRGNIGIGFSIPVNLAAFVMKSLVESGKVVRGYLGVATQELDAGLVASFDLKENRGALISEVTPESPAARAGLVAGDVVTALNEKPVVNRDELRLLVSQIPPGTKATLRIIREGKALAVEVTLGELDDERPIAARAAVELLDGVQVEPMSDALKRDFGFESDAAGVVVTVVERRSPYGLTLPVGTIIEKINKTTVSDPRSAKEALRKGRNTLVVRYGGTRKFVSLELAK